MSKPEEEFTHQFYSFIFATAGNGERHAGVSPAVQREAERFDSLGRTQRADHYGEIRTYKSMGHSHRHTVYKAEG